MWQILAFFCGECQCFPVVQYSLEFRGQWIWPVVPGLPAVSGLLKEPSLPWWMRVRRSGVDHGNLCPLGCAWLSCLMTSSPLMGWNLASGWWVYPFFRTSPSWMHIFQLLSDHQQGWRASISIQIHAWRGTHTFCCLIVYVYVSMKFATHVQYIRSSACSVYCYSTLF